jgi:hypothetical protein
VGDGALGPEPGFKPVPELNHAAPVLGFAAQLGGGGWNTALAVEVLYERMLVRLKEPSTVGFQLFGIGVAGSHYFERDWFLTAHLRWIGLLVSMPSVPCFWDRTNGTGGPGIGLTIGKEWFESERKGRREMDEDEGAIGLAVQGNYAHLTGSPELRYASGLVLVTFTHF